MGAFVRRPIQPLQQAKVDESLVKMIAKDFQPFSIVENEGFREYSQTLNPSYVLPSRHTISRRMLPNMYEKVRADLKDIIKDVSAVCLTTDCWTSRTTTSYIAVTCHYISDFELKSALLDCCTITEHHTAEQLAYKLDQVTQEWGIQGKVAACTTDNAKNIVKPVKDVLKWNHVGCMAHTLNLVVRHSLEGPDIQAIIQKVKNITEYMRKSTVAAAKLREIQKQMGQDELRPKQDVATRWNSTFYMLQRMLQIKEPLVSTLAIVNPTMPTLTLQEWENVKEACDVLQPFEEITTEMSSESFVTGSKAILIARGLQRFISHKQRTPPKSATVLDLINRLAAEMDKRLSLLERVPVLADATFLDPRFKKYAFVNDRYAAEAQARVERATTRAATPSSGEVEEVEAATSAAATASTPSQPVPVVWADFEERVTSLRPNLQNPHAESLLEVKGFLSEQLIPRTADPLEWWKVRSLVYKNLCTVMKTRLCIVATSVPSERVFSKTGQILSERRSNLTTDKVGQLAFLNANLQRTKK
nr:E3 SUMO-protein ligase ZBED1-like [Misgurnus anguillicaudatus]